MTNLTPKELVAALDEHIIGQADAKRAVAVAVRNRWRRLQIKGKDAERGINTGGIADYLTGKNILMLLPVR